METIAVRRSLRRETGRHDWYETTPEHRRAGTSGVAVVPSRTQGELVARATKTGKARVVPMPPGLAPRLRTHRASQAAERPTGRLPWQEDDWASAAECGIRIDPRRDWAEWKQVMSATLRFRWAGTTRLAP